MDLFSSITLVDNDYMKSQSEFTQYYESFSVFYGTLDTLLNTEMYKVKMIAGGNRATGSPARISVPVTGTPVTLPLGANIANGWNYVPCPYQYSVTLEDGALPTITYYQGDLVKSQTDFATYYDIPASASAAAFTGWYGQMTTMDPGLGYKLKTCRVAAATSSCEVVVPSFDTFGSPAFQSGLPEAPAGRRQLQAPAPATAPPGWSFDVSAHPETMTLTSVVSIDGEHPSSGILAAFVGDQVRGVSSKPSLAPFGAHKGRPMWFITIYGESDDVVTFKFHSAGTGLTLDKSLPFQPDGNQGSVLTPYSLSASTRSTLFGAAK